MDALVESMKRYKRFRRAQAMHLKAIASAVTGNVDAATAAAAAQAGDTAFHGDLGSAGAPPVPRNRERLQSDYADEVFSSHSIQIHIFFLSQKLYHKFQFL